MSKKRAPEDCVHQDQHLFQLSTCISKILRIQVWTPEVPQRQNGGWALGIWWNGASNRELLLVQVHVQLRHGSHLLKITSVKVGIMTTWLLIITCKIGGKFRGLTVFWHSWLNFVDCCTCAYVHNKFSRFNFRVHWRYYKIYPHKNYPL